MAGHSLKRPVHKPVDYKGGEHPQPVIKEFSSHHLYGPFLIIETHLNICFLV